MDFTYNFTNRNFKTNINNEFPAAFSNGSLLYPSRDRTIKPILP